MRSRKLLLPSGTPRKKINDRDLKTSPLSPERLGIVDDDGGKNPDTETTMMSVQPPETENNCDGVNMPDSATTTLPREPAGVGENADSGDRNIPAVERQRWKL
jgi:hypothetical protein